MERGSGILKCWELNRAFRSGLTPAGGQRRCKQRRLPHQVHYFEKQKQLKTAVNASSVLGGFGGSQLWPFGGDYKVYTETEFSLQRYIFLNLVERMNTFSHGNRTFNPFKRGAEIWPQMFVCIYAYKHTYFTLDKIAMSYKTLKY